MQPVQPAITLQKNVGNISRKNTPHPARRTLKHIGKQTESRHIILDICDYWGFSQHEGECWVDTIQQIFFFTDGLKEYTQPLFYKMTDQQLHSSIERAVQEGIIQDVTLTPRSSTPAPMIGGVLPPNVANNSSKSLSIFDAIKQGNTEEFKTLFENNSLKENIEYQNILLSDAGRYGQDAIVQFLLEKGANVNATDKNGFTPLIRAALYAHESTVQLLLENGANVNAQSKNGDTALILFVEDGSESIIRLLLEKGANVNATDKDGWTALIVAAQYGYESIMQLLLEKGADVNATNKDGSTALSMAIQKNHLNIIELLTKSTNAPFIASSVTPNIRAPPKAGSSLASIHEAGIKAMRDRFKHHYDVIVHKKEELCLTKGPQQIKKMYESSIAAPILLKRVESKRLGPSVAAGLQSIETQQKRLNIGKGYIGQGKPLSTSGGSLEEELSVNNLLFRTFNLPFRALWLVTALASKAPIYAIGVNMMHIASTFLFGGHATGFLKCKGQWYYYNDNDGLFQVSSGFIDALQTALNFNDEQEHPSICIKIVEDHCYLLSLNNVSTPYKYNHIVFTRPFVTGSVTPNQIWTEAGWIPFEKWKGANALEADKIETTVITTDNKEPSYYNVLKSAYCIVKYGPEYEDALFRSAITIEDIPYINTIDPNMIIDPVTGATVLIETVKKLVDIELILNNPKTDPNLQDKNGMTALMWAVTINSYSINMMSIDKQDNNIISMLNNPKVNPNIQDNKGMTALMYAIQRRRRIKEFIENPRIDLTIKTKGNLLGFGKKSALDFANQTKDPEIINLVKDAMARPKPTPPPSRTRKRSTRRQTRTRKLRH